ncbi:MASE3 domain-containing protein [Paludibacterium denitrificans]|uniref:Membrane-associated sensor domain-containing protein n=1 Tax=Paludibacterium denitrificans TaxID=2675226 RepID=A0A844GAJ0_9NEIS|nr:MASE3 domain-containing protein [Paludibacterium denitrificans]MTD32311.1 hypothetical protein [Paludibacterium denitrificans]
MATLSSPVKEAVGPVAEGSAIPWRLLAVLALVFLLIWQTPSLAWLSQGTSLFPLLTHTVEETFAIVVACLVFAVSWHASSRSQPGTIVILACGFLAVGLIDFAHMLSYQGMPAFITPASKDKAIIFWLAARYVAAITLLIVALRSCQPLQRSATRYLILAASLLVTAVIYYTELAHPELWPTMFRDGYGLTPAKIMAEVGIVLLLLLAAWLLYVRQQRHANADVANLFAATVVSMLAECCFMLYSNVNDVLALAGHSYKVIAYYYIYRAVFVSSVRAPYQRLQVEMAERQRAEQHIEFPGVP